MITIAEYAEFASKTLPLETTALYPLNDQRVKDDTGINVLVDMSHKCDFFTLWTHYVSRNKNEKY